MESGRCKKEAAGGPAAAGMTNQQWTVLHQRAGSGAAWSTGPPSRPNRVLFHTARTLNLIGQAWVTLSPRYEQLSAVRGPRQEEKGPEDPSKKMILVGMLQTRSQKFTKAHPMCLTITKGEVIEVPEVPVVAPSWNFSFASTQAHCLAARWPSSSLALVLVPVPVGPRVLCYTK